MDKLSEVLRRFSISAGVFYSGQLCGVTAFGDKESQVGHIHVLRHGRLILQDTGSLTRSIDEASLIFYPKPTVHRISADVSVPTEIVCATVHYGTGTVNPLSSALPDVLILSLKSNPRLQETTDWLFEEAFAEESAKSIMMDRLAEILIVQLLRHLLDRGEMDTGMFAGLAHPQLSEALNAIHKQPERSWSLQDLASLATMSRSKFAEVFRRVVGSSAGDYQMNFRIELAKNLLLQGKPVGWVANEVGYDTASALARVFRKKLGISPLNWLQAQQHKI